MNYFTVAITKTNTKSIFIEAETREDAIIQALSFIDRDWDTSESTEIKATTSNREPRRASVEFKP